jgi:hypothetical protein
MRTFAWDGGLGSVLSRSSSPQWIEQSLAGDGRGDRLAVVVGSSILNLLLLLLLSAG